MGFESIVEEIHVLGRDLVDKVRELIHEGNVQRIVVKDEHGNTFVEIPVTVAAVGAILAPLLAAVGAISALVAKFKIVVVRSEPKPPAGGRPLVQPDGLPERFVRRWYSGELTRLVFFCVPLLGLVASNATAQPTVLLDAMSQELNRNFTVLKEKADPPPYFLSYEITEQDYHSVIGHARDDRFHERRQEPRAGCFGPGRHRPSWTTTTGFAATAGSSRRAPRSPSRTA